MSPMVPGVHLWMMSPAYVEGLTAGWHRISVGVLCASVVPAPLKRNVAGTEKNQPVLYTLGRVRDCDVIQKGCPG